MNSTAHTESKHNLKPVVLFSAKEEDGALSWGVNDDFSTVAQETRHKHLKYMVANKQAEMQVATMEKAQAAGSGSS